MKTKNMKYPQIGEKYHVLSFGKIPIEVIITSHDYKRKESRIKAEHPELQIGYVNWNRILPIPKRKES